MKRRATSVKKIKDRRNPMSDLLKLMKARRRKERPSVFDARYLLHEIRDRYHGEISVVVSPRYSAIFRNLAKFLGARYWYPEMRTELHVGESEKILQTAHLVTGADCLRQFRSRIRGLLYQFNGGVKPHQFVHVYVCLLKPARFLIEGGAEVISLNEVNKKKWKRGAACPCPGVHRKRRKCNPRKRRAKAA